MGEGVSVCVGVAVEVKVALAPGLGVSVAVGVMTGVEVGTAEGVGVETRGIHGVQVGDGSGKGPAGANTNMSAPVQ